MFLEADGTTKEASRFLCIWRSREPPSSLLARPRPCSSSHAAGPARFRARNQNGSRAPSWPSFRLRAGRAVAGADLVVTPLRAALCPDTELADPTSRRTRLMEGRSPEDAWEGESLACAAAKRLQATKWSRVQFAEATHPQVACLNGTK